MMARKIFSAVSVVITCYPAIALAAADPITVRFADLVRKQEVLVDPFPVSKVKYEDEKGVEQTASWSSLSGQVQREQLPNEYLFVETRKFEGGANFSIVPVKVAGTKGSYELVFRWMKYRVEYCSLSDPAAGHVRIGVGMNIVMTVVTKKGNLDVSGLGPVSAAAWANQVGGTISVGTIGLGTSSKVLSGFLTSSSITEDTVDNADKAIAVVRAVIESSDTKLTPHRLAVVERTPGACTGETPPVAPPTVKTPA